MNTRFLRLPSFLSPSRLRTAGLAALLSCVGCCALPLVAAAAGGSGAVALLSKFVRPGSELIVGTVVFAIALGAMALVKRSKSASSCSEACNADGACCDRGASPVTRSA